MTIRTVETPASSTRRSAEMTEIWSMQIDQILATEASIASSTHSAFLIAFQKRSWRSGSLLDDDEA